VLSTLSKALHTHVDRLVTKFLQIPTIFSESEIRPIFRLIYL